ncbi:MAG: hypothetical protein ACKPFA_10185, partial [Dolichospermum sp.]
MEKPDEIKLKELEKRFKAKQEDIEAVSNQITETKDAETKNQLERQENRLYEELKKIEQEIEKLKSGSFSNLINILTANLDTAINSAIQTAYKACCSSGNIPDTVQAIVQDLYDLDKRNLDSNEKFNHNDNTAKFIKSLITNSQIPQTKLEDLEKWGSNNIEDFDRLIQDVNQQYQNTHTKPESYILIKIEPLTTKSRSK